MLRLVACDGLDLAEFQGTDSHYIGLVGLFLEEAEVVSHVELGTVGLNGLLGDLDDVFGVVFVLFGHQTQLHSLALLGIFRWFARLFVTIVRLGLCFFGERCWL